MSPAALAAASGAVLILSMATVSMATVVGRSMEPSLGEGDTVFFRRYGRPQRYDVVRVRVDGKNLVKRVIGLPGDVISLRDGHVSVNGAPAEYDFRTEEAGAIGAGYLVPEGGYFVLGDNRQHSRDSRAFGSVPAGNVKGIMVGGREGGRDV